jgi:hypothetical protein
MSCTYEVFYFFCLQGTIGYNSSYVLVCVSIDRLYAIVRPMDVRTASSGIDSNNPKGYFHFIFLAFRYSLIIGKIKTKNYFFFNLIK